MTRVVLPEAKLFKEIVEAIGNIAEEVALNLTPEGLKLSAFDVDQSSLFMVNFPPEMFIEYDVGEPVKIGVSVSNLKKILKHIKKGENLVIEPEGDYVKFTIGAGAVATSMYRFRNLDVPVQEISELELNFTVTAKLMAQALKRVIEDIEATGGNTEFSADENALVIRAVGAGRLEAKFTKGSLALISFELQEPAKATYDTAKLVNILAAAKVSDTVTIQFANKMPLKAEFIVGPGKIVYLLAPFEVS
ncbi:MAG: DNA polymerase sliding clamp [Desulfurococcaceae archaeon]